ncbi:LacI family transcriptional regulator [Cellulomonas composti]|uniref:LacI family transcriptional regulator n=2 Tax=Cellulomonas composti TaxID=266130 RepID=A0A511JC73_9CELL|nr:LacI family DNA-binding transcriptional regulator [Cellulomonas composti]GEL95590.1 LacI family transcriptional regulator [Cellulomonas composti]
MTTIDDVARAAGVSVSTVSYALSGKRPISAATRTRIERAVQELDYRPHAGARALASARTNVLALMAPLRVDVNVGVIMQFVTGVVTRAQYFQHDVLLLTQDDHAGVERVAAGSMVDAVIMMDVEADDPRLAILRRQRQPAVLIGLPRDATGLSCVDLDFEAAARTAVAHLTGLGHRAIALLGSPQTVLDRHTTYAARLVHGFDDETSRRGLNAVFEPTESSHAGAVLALDRAFARLPRLSALVVHNEAALPGVLASLRERGLRVPQDVSVVAVCPQDVAVGQPQQLTAVDIPAVRIGGVAVEMAMGRLERDDPAETRLISPVLTARESTGPAPA